MSSLVDGSVDQVDPTLRRFVTYNILTGGHDAGGGDRLDRILGVLRPLRPHVLALNECNGFDADGDARLRRVAAELGMSARLATASSGYHVALLWRDAHMTRCDALDAGLCHAAIHAELQLEGAVVQILAAHLDPFSAERRLGEVNTLLQRVSDLSNLVLMGDLNSVGPRDASRYDLSRWPERYIERHAAQGGSPDTRAIAAIETRGLVDLAAASDLGKPAAVTRPTRLYHKRDVPEQRLDYIFASPDLARLASTVHVVDDDRAQHASDHLPVFADLRVGGPG